MPKMSKAVQEGKPPACAGRPPVMPKVPMVPPQGNKAPEEPVASPTCLSEEGRGATRLSEMNVSHHNLFEPRVRRGSDGEWLATFTAQARRKPVISSATVHPCLRVASP